MAGNLLVIFSMFRMLLYILTVIVSSCFLSNYDIPKMHYEGPDICVESHFRGDETETECAPTWTNGRHSPLSPLRRIEMAVAATVTSPAPAPAEAGARDAKRLEATTAYHYYHQHLGTLTQRSSNINSTPAVHYPFLYYATS